MCSGLDSITLTNISFGVSLSVDSPLTDEVFVPLAFANSWIQLGIQCSSENHTKKEKTKAMWRFLCDIALACHRLAHMYCWKLGKTTGSRKKNVAQSKHRNISMYREQQFLIRLHSKRGFSLELVQKCRFNTQDQSLTMTTTADINTLPEPLRYHSAWLKLLQWMSWSATSWSASGISMKLP